MIIKAKIKNNISLNAHPIGCYENIKEQLADIKDYPSLNSNNLNVLIIGGSSGYGLASRLVLLEKNNSFIYNVSYESSPSKRLSGSAGFFNNYYVNKISKDKKVDSVDLNIDCFSNEAKEKVIEYFKSNNKKIDLIVYSVASSIRVDPKTNIKYQSSLKPIGSSYNGYYVDVSKDSLNHKELEAANKDEIANTIKVMGGEDYLLWVEALDQANLLNDGIKTVAYTYIGATTTFPIYRDGTIGQAKKDLEKKNETINALLNKYNGKAYVVSAKSVVTKASIFIPTVPLYMSALFKVMKKYHKHETISQHIYRLFNDIIYGDKILIDDNNIVRLDAYELEENIQKEVNDLLDQVSEDNFVELLDYNYFKNEFYKINGFNFDNVNYEEDIDLEQYI